MSDIKLLTVVAASLARLDKDIQEEAWLSSLWSLRDSFESLVRLFVACGYAAMPIQRMEGRDKLVASQSSLGTWVQELRSLTQQDSEEELLDVFYQIRKAPECNESWNLLFEGQDNFVSFRNKTIGHGAFTKEDHISQDVMRYTDAIKKVISVASNIFSSAVIIEVEGKRIKDTWRECVLLYQGKQYNLSPLILMYHSNDEARVMMFDSAKIKKTATANYLDYVFGNHDVCYDFNSFVDINAIISLSKKIKRGQSSALAEKVVKSNQKHQRQALHVPYIENHIAKLTDSTQGKVLFLFGEGGVGKSWILKNLLNLKPNMDGPDWQWNNPLYSENTLKLTHKVSDINFLHFWDNLNSQLKAMGYKTPNIDIDENKHSLFSHWVELVRDLNPFAKNSFILLCFDGLDELENSKDVESYLSDWFIDMPDNTMLVFSSRPQLGHRLNSFVNVLKSRTACSKVSIDPQAEENLALQRKLLTFKLKCSPNLVEKILERSKGVFLYTVHYANAIEKGMFHENDDLPESAEFYNTYFEHLRCVMGEKIFDRIYLRLLLILSCSKTGVGFEVLHDCWSMPPKDVLDSVVSDLSEFITEDRCEGRAVVLRLAHLSVSEYLQNTQKEELKVLEAGFVDKASSKLQSSELNKMDFYRDLSAIYYLLYSHCHAESSSKLYHRILGNRTLGNKSLELVENARREVTVWERLSFAKRASETFEYINDSVFLSKSKLWEVFCFIDLGYNKRALDILLHLDLTSIDADYQLLHSMLLSKVYHHLGDKNNEQQVLEKGIALIDKCGNNEFVAQWLLARSSFLNRSGKTQESIEVASQVEALVNIDELYLIKGRISIITSYFYASRNSEALTLLVQTQKEFSEYLISDESLNSDLIYNKGLISHNMDRNQDVIDSFENLTGYYKHHGRVSDSLLSMINLGDGHWGVGNYIKSEEYIEKALKEGVENSLPHIENIAAICLANVLSNSKPNEKVSNLYERGITLSEEIGHDWDLMYGKIYQAKWFLSQSDKDFNENISTLDEMGGLAREAGYEYLEVIASAFKARYLYHYGYVEKAAEAALLCKARSDKHEIFGCKVLALAILILCDKDKNYVPELIGAIKLIQGVKSELPFFVQTIKNLEEICESPEVQHFLAQLKLNMSDLEGEIKMEDDITKLKRCDLAKCQGMCCYDGVYLEEGEENKIRMLVLSYSDFFSFLPEDFIVEGSWEGKVQGKKTQVKPFDYTSDDFPKHFNRTRCVFALEDARCSLQVLADKMSMHPWSLKPKSCWMHPLSVVNGELAPPPVNKSDDYDNLGDKYPGYVCYTECGQHMTDGKPWNETLEEEIKYYETVKGLGGI